MRRAILVITLFAIASAYSDTYQRAPKAISDILRAPANPSFSLSPSQDRYVLAQGIRYPTIADLAQPMLRLAGSRINPITNGPHNPTRYTAFTVKFLDGREKRLPVPSGGALGGPIWAPKGHEFAFTNTTSNGIELWIANTDKGTTRKIPGVTINAAYGQAIRWMPLGEGLLVRMVPSNRGKPPIASVVPEGPDAQETSGRAAPAPTFQDLLKNEDDAKLWEYYATSQLAVINIEFGVNENNEAEAEMPKRLIDPIGKPGIYASIDPNPTGKLFLVERTVRPYSYSLTAGGFAKQVEVWDYTGKLVKQIADLPNEEQVPLGGVPVGPRNVDWRPTNPNTLIWVEAMDGGNPRTKIAFRDRIVASDFPFRDEPKELTKLQYRFTGLTWLERASLAIVSENDRDRLWSKTWLYDFATKDAPKLMWERNTRDRYGDPGSIVMRTRRDGQAVGMMVGNSIYTRGAGASPKGDRPFLDKWDITTMKPDRIWQSRTTGYETITSLLDDNVTRFITNYESPTEVPNFYLVENGARKPLTTNKDSAPIMQQVKKQLVTYKRPDGIDLSFTLYLPPGYKEGTRLPTVIWAYPLEFTDASTAGQVTSTTNRYTAVGGTSPLFMCLAGYAVLMDATIPIVGNPETVNDTFIDQLVSSAKAAIDKAVEMGVTDRNRVAVMGHSYGAFMTANLLAHTDLFKAGVARSGAYNRTLTPFGFQSERRTLWQAAEMYLKVSPFMYADKIKTPILLTHGMLDNNTGTFPIQSERLYQAIKGNGGTARLVMLPYESHGYGALESIEHVNYETIAWLDKYVKGK